VEVRGFEPLASSVRGIERPFELTRERADQRQRLDGVGPEGHAPGAVTEQERNGDPAEPPAQRLQRDQAEQEEAEQTGTAAGLTVRQLDTLDRPIPAVGMDDKLDSPCAYPMGDDPEL
jgi:hypothetical protein